MLVVSIVFKATRHLAQFNDFLLNYMLQLATMGVAVVLFGTLYYILVERPCMDPKWPLKLWQFLTRTRHAHPSVARD
jgi:peptidoglycan/LPS O-acetylase OafA/YrhL